MTRIALNIARAAKAANVKEDVIVRAVRDKSLIARRVEGDHTVILCTDLQAWLETKPSYR